MITINIFSNCTFNGNVFVGLGFIIIIIVLVIILSIKNKVLKKVLKMIDLK